MGGLVNFKLNCYQYDPTKSKLYTIEKDENSKNNDDIGIVGSFNNKVLKINPIKIGYNIPDVND
jgi:hypothetical protein